MALRLCTIAGSCNPGRCNYCCCKLSWVACAADENMWDHPGPLRTDQPCQQPEKSVSVSVVKLKACYNLSSRKSPQHHILDNLNYWMGHNLVGHCSMHGVNKQASGVTCCFTPVEVLVRCSSCCLRVPEVLLVQHTFHTVATHDKHVENTHALRNAYLQLAFLQHMHVHSTSLSGSL